MEVQKTEKDHQGAEIRMTTDRTTPTAETAVPAPPAEAAGRRRPSAKPRLRAVAMACALLALAALAAAPSASASFGELSRFKGKGTNGTGAEFVFSGLEAHAFSVDQSSGNIYVGTEAAVEDERLKVQSYNSSGEWQASTVLKPPAKLPEHILTTEEWEGFALDPKDSRIFALLTYKRQAEGVVDFNRPTAGALYALNTKLEPAEGATPLLGTAETLQGASTEQGKSLLEPSGLVYDPKNGDVLILGVIDTGSESLHPAVERVSPKGEVLSGWVDPGTVSRNAVPDSPVVSPNGTLFFEGNNEVLAVSAKGLEENAAPESVYTLAEPAGFTTGPFAGEMVSFGFGETSYGGGLSIRPEGSSGQLVLFSEIQAANETGELGENRNGALVLNYSEAGGHVTISENGWTGGQPGEGKGEKHNPCVIGFNYANPLVAAGTGEAVWVLSPAWGEVIKFGPGGTGCPAAKEAAGGLEVLLAGKKVANPEVTNTVTLEAKVVQGNVLSTTWKFGDGQEAVLASQPGEQTQTALTTHKFAKAGKLTVEAIVHTDNLATPTITYTTTVNVTEAVAGAPKVTKQPLPLSLVEGEAAKFEAAASGEPAPTVQWEESRDNGETWKAIGGATTTTYTVESVIAAQSGTEYRAVFENGKGTPATSVGAKLTVESKQAHKEKVEHEEAEHRKQVEEEEAALRRAQEEARARVAAEEAATRRAQEEASARAAAEAAARKAAEEAAHREGSPAATAAGGTIKVASNGSFAIKVSCPAGVTSCSGSVTLKGLAGRKVITLASGSFTVAGGSSRSITLHLSAPARKLLAKSHTVRAKVTVLASNPSGASAATSSTLTLKAGR